MQMTIGTQSQMEPTMYNKGWLGKKGKELDSQEKGKELWDQNNVNLNAMMRVNYL